MDNTNSITDNKIQMAFAAIDKSLMVSVPNLIEKEVRGKGYISYGDDNTYPEYLYGLFTTVSTLKTVIEGTAEFIAGDDITGNMAGMETEINPEGDTWRNLVNWLAKDWCLYGGFCFEVIRDKALRPCALHYIDFRYIRSDKDNNLFFYSEEYGQKYNHSSKVIALPRFIRNGKDARSLVYVKNTKTGTYPLPLYSGAIKACEIERNIDEFHLEGLQNGFYGSYIFNFANGIPTDEEKGEIEKNVNEKFAGAPNAGRILLNFSDSKINGLSVDKIDVVDFSEKYQAAATRSREQIFCSFGAVPQLFGLTSEATGFSEQEFSEAFKLYNRTRVRGVQRVIVDAFDKVFDIKGSITIKPFSIEENNTTSTTVE